ncbi:YegS/Rv2252/BmrU family lipid kinase [Nocardioides sp. zg-1228]|uniref:YegS/Rv2252/BmrU family lipid kinase n=1 Tax=Nocardioides sp. zg-1228 TaxID=2763008 RepID=UPI0016427A2B|nr:YegS/Rv2252/BmrU family lipid kinase [Nocardioides sp. zg-1228]MBC2932257.1 YegS/Rv2252/BmrU family lipid kinase [Nocardioides sp. zg-1228]QSF57783.1 YegS/Rv2252/BmrU family lipid kinase [Nocardioides sp. zg-1228]
MLDHRRSVLLAWAALASLAFAGLAFAVTRDRLPLDGLDRLGRSAEDWADDHALLVDVLRVVEVAFGTIGMTVLTALLALVLLLRRHRWAALLVVVVMAVTSAATTGLKLWLGRDRPDWQDTFGSHLNFSFPSGHASSTAAFAALLVILLALFVRRTSARRLGIAIVVAWWLLVCLDRVLLGRHFPTDVIGGSLLGVAVALVALAFIDPRPRSIAARTEPLTEVYASQRRLAVILNPIKVEDVGQFRSLVASMAEEAGWSEPTWQYTTVEDPGRGMAERAAVAGTDLVLVCGGDGTVREVCAELAGTGIPVGIVPAGTGNLLARNLGLPLYIRAAIDVALNGQDRAIDMVEVGGDGIEDTHFMVMAGMGFDAALMEGVNEDIKKRIGWAAYFVSGLRSLMFPAARFEIQIDDEEPTVHRARTVVVGNVGFLQAGMPLLPDATIDDGILDVVIIHPRQFLSWITVAMRVLRKSTIIDETIDRRTGARVRIKAFADTPRQLDGDSVGEGRELWMECIHGRLLVRVPR